MQNAMKMVAALVHAPIFPRMSDPSNAFLESVTSDRFMLLMDLQLSMPDVMGCVLSPSVQLAASAYPSVSLPVLRSFAFAALCYEPARHDRRTKRVAILQGIRIWRLEP
ncbi:mlr6258 [Mesorhizobium japonicum MAFF 303099]|uniref:Mlr6258 protein n=1 Tax=Mesorhizobium japonicum (strain LMG 29417 / CECT 9101 / MAFF 303099) TaxID=266835 RepID=Q989W3_RHILO|nr:mlr6258 [Mesorhizobium japonicum MAFF 303099]